MGKADALSRMTGLETGVNDNSDVVLLKPEFFVRQLSQDPEEDVIKRIKKVANNVDKEVTKALADHDPDWTKEDNGTITWKNRIYVPIDRELRSDIIKKHHDTITVGHPGQYKTWEMITRNYWWPRIGNDVRRYIKGCLKCQSSKTKHTKPAGKLHPHDVPTEPWQVISVDLIGELPKSGGYDAIAVFNCHMTKRIRLFPTHMSLTSEGMAKIYRDKIFPVHGLCRKIIHVTHLVAEQTIPPGPDGRPCRQSEIPPSQRSVRRSRERSSKVLHTAFSRFQERCY